MRQIAGKTLLLLGIILVAVALFDAQNSQVRGDSVRSLRLSPTPVQPVPVAICDYTDVTQIIAQRLGLSIGSFDILQMEKIDSRYISILLNLTVLNPSDLYLYDLGIDGQWNTQDDGGFFIDETFKTPNIMTSSNGVRTLFWTSYFDIKSCTLTSQGCTNIQTFTTFTNIFDLSGYVSSSSQNRMYMAYVDLQFNLIFASCSMQQGTPDNCNNSQTTFVTHQTLSYPPQMSVVKSLPGAGFIYVQGLAVTLGRFFNIDLPTPGTVLLPSTLQFLQPTYFLPGLLIAIQTTTVPTGQLSELVFLDPQTGSITAIVDTLNNPMFPISPLIIDVTNNGFITIYYQQNDIMGKRIGMPAVSLYIRSQNDNPIPQVILPDGSVLGRMGNRPSTQFIRFNCVP